MRVLDGPLPHGSRRRANPALIQALHGWWGCLSALPTRALASMHTKTKMSGKGMKKAGSSNLEGTHGGMNNQTGPRRPKDTLLATEARSS